MITLPDGACLMVAFGYACGATKDFPMAVERYRRVSVRWQLMQTGAEEFWNRLLPVAARLRTEKRRSTVVETHQHTFMKRRCDRNDGYQDDGDLNVCGLYSKRFQDYPSN